MSGLIHQWCLSRPLREAHGNSCFKNRPDSRITQTILKYNSGPSAYEKASMQNEFQTVVFINLVNCVFVI